MQNSNPNYISVDEFNNNIRRWTLSTRGKMRTNINTSKKADSKDSISRNTKKLDKSITYKLKKDKGEVIRIRYSFEKHGIYLHYGVGRGYVKNGSSVTRGIRVSKKTLISKAGAINRKPKDWFDKEIKNNLSHLANVVQEYHGDKALKEFTKSNTKALISKK